MKKEKKDNLVKLKQEYTIFLIVLFILITITAFFIIKDKENIIKEINELKENQKDTEK